MFALFSWRIDFNKGIKSSKEDSFYKNMKVVKTALKVWQANYGIILYNLHLKTVC